MDVLLGTDVPELGRLLSQASEWAEVFMATTRAQAKKEAKAEQDSLGKELRSGVRPNPILLDEPQEETWNLGEELDDTIFHGGRDKLVQSRSQKWEGRRMHRAKVCLDPPVCMQNTQDISAEELRILQETDPMLGVIRNAVDKKESASGPTLRKDVADFCKRCETCQKTSRVKPQHTPMIPLPIVDEPFQRIAMDIVGPLPRSSSGNRYVLVVCDYATRYPEAMPKQWQRNCQLLAELYRLLHIRPIRTSPYHPQTDGLVERFNQTLKSMLRKVPQSSTGFSPFELLYGREVRGPLDVLQESWVAKEKSSENVVSHIMSIREKMAQMTMVVQENLEKMQASQKSWYDQNARVRTLNEGAMVLILLPMSSSALTAQWQGSYKVVKQVGKVHYLIDMHDRRKRKRVFHINMLREFLSNSSAACTSYWSGNLDVDEDDEIPVWNGSRADNGAEDSPQFGLHLTKAQRDEVDALLCELSAVMSNTPWITHLTEHRIETGEKVEKEIQEMLGGIITPSNSEWRSPVVLVKKKDRSLRLCVDYQRLNSVSESDAYPMMTSLTNWEKQVMPFGLQGAPATFQRLMDRIVKGCEKFAAAYLDDLIIYRLTAKPNKCQFAMAECTYLGRIFGSGTVKPQPSKVLAVESFGTPKTKTQVRVFLGLTGYYRRGIGAALSQRDAEGGENPIAYFSKKLLPREERYSTIEKECLAIKPGMEAFRTYLLNVTDLCLL
eukprot:Em0006g929a